MAVFYPSFETISNYRTSPTEGELALLQFLNKTLDDSFEVYFNPYLNGDRPDVIIMRKNYGVMIVEVKDWNLYNFTLNNKKKWVYTPNGAIVKSPFDQVLRYKENLFDLHVENLLKMKIMDYRKFNIVKCAVYFHAATQSQLQDMLIEPFKDDDKYQKWLNNNITLLGRDDLQESRFNSVLRDNYLISDKESFIFTNEIYTNIKRLLSPSVHLGSDIPINYTPQQKRIIYDTKHLEQRVRGVFGSGKTTILAARAVEAYKRALTRNSNPRILILTYNITLKNFIHDKLNRVDEVFDFNHFIIINYHQFIKAELNNLNIEITIPNGLENWQIDNYLENYYFGNIRLFEANKDYIVKYDAVLIDEIQDYHRNWMEIIKKYFRDPKGDYFLCGDIKQNIYSNTVVEKDIPTNVKGVNDLKYCHRSEFKVRDLAESYQKKFFSTKYIIDNFEENKEEDLFHHSEKEGYINYIYLNEEANIPTLYNIVRGNILSKENNVSENDITILGYTTNLLRTFDLYYRQNSRERANSMLETVEVMYMKHLNYITNNNSSRPENAWFKNIQNHLQKKMFPKRDKIFDNDLIKIRQEIAVLFSIYDLYTDFNETFKERLNEICITKCGININAFLEYRKHYEKELQKFKEEVYKDDYKVIRDNKKLHFWMNSGTIKISTINSFKGWESEVVILIIEPKYKNENNFNRAFDELLYTGFTRCKRDLIIINFGNKEYDERFRPLVDESK